MQVSLGQITHWISCHFYTFSATRDIFEAVCNKGISGNSISLVSRTGPKFDSKYVITDIRHYARHMLTFKRLPLGTLMDTESTMARKWEGKSLRCNLSLLCQSKTGWLSLIRTILYRVRADLIKQIHVPSFLNLENKRLNFGGNFAAAHADGILTSSMTINTINNQDTTPSANQKTGNSGSFEMTCSVFQIKLSV